MMKLSHTALGAILAAVAILANLEIASVNHAWQEREAEAQWKTQIEQRLVRVETKLDRLLNVTQAALTEARKIPQGG